MKKETCYNKAVSKTTIIKKCHACGYINEAQREMENCKSCNKGFLPLNYFAKIHAQTHDQYKSLFASSDEINENEIIKGLYVLW